MKRLNLIELSNARRANEVVERCKELTRITHIAKMPYDVITIYACTMFAATIARQLNFDKARFLKWCGDTWDACEKHQR